jgi:long-chain acyl-CoA synthetase
MRDTSANAPEADIETISTISLSVPMDSVQSREVSAACFPVEERANHNESPIYRNIHCQVENGGGFIATFRAQPDSRTVIDILQTNAAKSPNADCTGERVIGPDGSAGRYL